MASLAVPAALTAAIAGGSCAVSTGCRRPVAGGCVITDLRRGVGVAVYPYVAPAARAHGQRKRFVAPSAAMAQLAGRVPAVNLAQGRVVPGALVLKLPHELGHPRIRRTRAQRRLRVIPRTLSVSTATRPARCTIAAVPLWIASFLASAIRACSRAAAATCWRQWELPFRFRDKAFWRRRRGVASGATATDWRRSRRCCAQLSS